METVEERVSFLEGRVGEQGQMVQSFRDALLNQEGRLDRRFLDVEDRSRQRFDVMERRFDGIDRRFEGFERRFETIDQKFDGLDHKLSRQFLWLVGLHVTTLIAMVGALGGVIAAILTR